MISSESKKGKKLHIEFLRFFCIWLVMFTHTSTAGFSLYLLRPESFFFPFYIAVPFWVKTAVPIFFMISGALLLKRKNRSLSSLRNEYGDLHKSFLSSPLLIIFIFTTDLIYHSLDTSLNFLRWCIRQIWPQRTIFFIFILDFSLCSHSGEYSSAIWQISFSYT